MILVSTEYGQYSNEVLTEFVVVGRKKRIKNREAEPSIYTYELSIFRPFLSTIATNP